MASVAVLTVCLCDNQLSYTNAKKASLHNYICIPQGRRMWSMSLPLVWGLARKTALRDVADLAPVTVSTCGSLTTSVLLFRVMPIPTAANPYHWEEHLGLLWRHTSRWTFQSFLTTLPLPMQGQEKWFSCLKVRSISMETTAAMIMWELVLLPPFHPLLHYIPSTSHPLFPSSLPFSSPSPPCLSLQLWGASYPPPPLVQHNQTEITTVDIGEVLPTQAGIYYCMTLTHIFVHVHVYCTHMHTTGNYNLPLGSRQLSSSDAPTSGL